MFSDCIKLYVISTLGSFLPSLAIVFDINLD